MDKLLADLNEAQREAVTATEGYVRVVAGAGTGKTKTLSRRFVYLAEALGISPAAILCVTFTNQAAAEMKRRIRALLPGRDLGYICTFHSFAVTLLREDCHVVQYPETFAVLDNLDKEDMLKGIFADLGITSRKLTVKDASDYIACYKGGHDYVPHLIDPDLGKLSRAEAAAGDLRQKVLWRYLYETRKTFGLDFDDLIYFALHILRTDEASREKWQSRLEYIMVDEYQDIDKDEYALSEIPVRRPVEGDAAPFPVGVIIPVHVAALFPVLLEIIVLRLEDHVRKGRQGQHQSEDQHQQQNCDPFHEHLSFQSHIKRRSSRPRP